MIAFAPCEIRFSTSASCCSADDPASVEMYSAPQVCRASWIAGSSNLAHRSSLKLFQETPTVRLPPVAPPLAPPVVPVSAAAVVATRGEQDDGERQQGPHTPSQHLNPPFWTERPCDVPALPVLRTGRPQRLRGTRDDRPVEGSGALGRLCLGRARQHGTFGQTAQSVRRAVCCARSEAPDSLPPRATSRIERTIRDPIAPSIARQGRMQGVGPTTDTGADPGDGGKREPRRGRRATRSGSADGDVAGARRGRRGAGRARRRPGGRPGADERRRDGGGGPPLRRGVHGRGHRPRLRRRVPLLRGRRRGDLRLRRRPPARPVPRRRGRPGRPVPQRESGRRRACGSRRCPTPRPTSRASPAPTRSTSTATA